MAAQPFFSQMAKRKKHSSTTIYVLGFFSDSLFRPIIFIKMILRDNTQLLYQLAERAPISAKF